MNQNDLYLHVKWTKTSFMWLHRSCLKILKDEVRFMTKQTVKSLPDIDTYSYISSVGGVYIKYGKNLLNWAGEYRGNERHMILPLSLLLFRYSSIYKGNSYKMRCRCSEKNSKFKFLLPNSTIRDSIEGTIDKISENHIQLVTDISIILDKGFIVGIFFEYLDAKGKRQRFLGRVS